MDKPIPRAWFAHLVLPPDLKAAFRDALFGGAWPVVCWEFHFTAGDPPSAGKIVARIVKAAGPFLGSKRLPDQLAISAFFAAAMACSSLQPRFKEVDEEMLRDVNALLVRRFLRGAAGEERIVEFLTQFGSFIDSARPSHRPTLN